MNKTLFVLLALGLAYATGGAAAERKAYKHVDEKGNVTYSQSPPEKDAKPIDITPAYQGRGGYPSASKVPPAHDDRRADQARENERRRQEAQKQRLAQLEAECNRQRGTDCKNPETLRYMDSQRIPYRR